MRNRLVIPLVTAILGAVGVVSTATPAEAAGGPVRTSHKCNWKTYKNHYTARTTAKKPVVTHLHAYAMPPSSSHKVTKSASRQTILKANVAYKSKTDISVSVAKKIMAAASVSAEITLAASGSRTVDKTVTVTDTIANKSRRNAQYVFFRGNMSAQGTFRYTYCGRYYTPTGTVGDYVYYKDGTWKSFQIYSDGAARCGAKGAVNAVTRAALAQGC
jgi:hypothetical protein